jgi:DNA-binding MarR family transcriptional regulator
LRQWRNQADYQTDPGNLVMMLKESLAEAQRVINRWDKARGVLPQICLDNTCFNGYHIRMVPTIAAPADRSAHKPRRHKHFDSPQQEAYLNLWRTYDRLRMLEDELFGRSNLSAQQYNTLRLLRAAHPKKVPTLHLGSRLISRAPDITRLLDKLGERGLIVRDRPPDNRRIVNVGITDAGLALLEELADEVRECHLRQLGHLDPREMKKLVELLQKARQPHETEGSDWK